MFVKVAIPRPLDALFDYEYDEESLGKIQIGDLVRVPFGKATANACVLEISQEKPILPEKIKLKKVSAKLEAEMQIPEVMLRFCKFASEYYQYPIGEALFVATPPKPEKVLGTRAEKEKQYPKSGRVLTNTQQVALDQILKQTSEKSDSVFLLEGVTGSGKTEVYIECVREVLKSGKSALILVPEIALTSQLKDRFESGLGSRVALWHSALADGLRQTQWKKVRSGEIKMVIGARSAIFAPFLDLGIIIIDEEHDQTYKQEERFRYQARDLALYRAKQLKIPLVLGSATPSLETLQRVKEGKIIPLTLPSRFSKQALPEIVLVSLAEDPVVGAGTVKTPLAETTVRAMQATIDRGEQVLIFLNRRGFSQFILCQACGWVKKCDQCSISMTHYQRRNELKCHICGKKERVPSQCETCQSTEVYGMGSGTESLEDDLQLVLTNAKTLRLDRDQVTSQKRLEETLQDFRDLKANVLIGTQMLVKGHDFPKVTCVVVVSVDSLLQWPDFRSSERALQTLIQVSGRSGRAELPGKVYLQGYDLEHPVIQILTGVRERADFVKEELELRELLHYPPFSRLVRYRFEHENEETCKRFADQVAAEVSHYLGDTALGRLMGPSEAVLFRAQNRYRFDLYFKSPNTDLLFRVSKAIKMKASQANFEVVVDVDPYNS